FTSGQVLWTHFIVNAPFGIALGFDQATPGLMKRRPRPRGESVLNRGLLVTCGLVGLFMAIASLLLIQIGKHHWGSVDTGRSIAFTSLCLMLIVAAFESRSETRTVFTTDTFASSKMNWIAAAEFVGAILVTSLDAFRRLLGTVPLTTRQFGLAL